MSQERRRHRSTCTQQALNLSLCAAARDARIAGVVLCDEQGLLIAGSLKGPAAELLAAAGAVLSATGTLPNACGPRLPSRIVAKRFRSAQGVLCLCAAGAPGDGRTAIRIARTSVGRILRTMR